MNFIYTSIGGGITGIETLINIVEQLKKHNGILIVFTQLRTSTGDFFAQDLLSFYGALVTKYVYGNDGQDSINTYFKTTKIRDSRTGKQNIEIPLKYDVSNKSLEIAV